MECWCAAFGSRRIALVVRDICAAACVGKAAAKLTRLGGSDTGNPSTEVVWSLVGGFYVASVVGKVREKYADPVGYSDVRSWDLESQVPAAIRAIAVEKGWCNFGVFVPQAQSRSAPAIYIAGPNRKSRLKAAVAASRGVPPGAIGCIEAVKCFSEGHDDKNVPEGVWGPSNSIRLGVKLEAAPLGPLREIIENEPRVEPMLTANGMFDLGSGATTRNGNEFRDSVTGWGNRQGLGRSQLRRSPYLTLGIEPTYQIDVIERAYRWAALSTHPDRLREIDLAVRGDAFQEIRAAKEALAHPQTHRNAYNAARVEQEGECGERLPPKLRPANGHHGTPVTPGELMLNRALKTSARSILHNTGPLELAGEEGRLVALGERADAVASMQALDARHADAEAQNAEGVGDRKRPSDILELAKGHQRKRVENDYRRAGAAGDFSRRTFKLQAVSRLRAELHRVSLRRASAANAAELAAGDPCASAGTASEPETAQKCRTFRSALGSQFDLEEYWSADRKKAVAARADPRQRERPRRASHVRVCPTAGAPKRHHTPGERDVRRRKRALPRLTRRADALQLLTTRPGPTLPKVRAAQSQRLFRARHLAAQTARTAATPNGATVNAEEGRRSSPSVCEHMRAKTFKALCRREDVSPSKLVIR